MDTENAHNARYENGEELIPLEHGGLTLKAVPKDWVEHSIFFLMRDLNCGLWVTIGNRDKRSTALETISVMNGAMCKYSRVAQMLQRATENAMIQSINLNSSMKIPTNL